MFTVNRIGWLRTKARYDRWKEEFNTVRREMGFTVKWFDYRHSMWDQYSKQVCAPQQMGHWCYAEKQKWLWMSMAKEAKQVFGDKADYK